MTKLALVFLGLASFALAQQPVVRDLSCSASSASGSAYTCSIQVSPPNYVPGQEYRFKADVANTGAATINLNSLGAVPIKKVSGGVNTALAANDIQIGQWVYLTFDGTNMQMASQLGNAGGGGGSGTVTNIVVSAPLTGGTITTSGNIGCPTATGSQAGCLSAADWTTFNAKQGALTLPLTVANGGTGTATPGLIQGTNITITGSWPNQTITASSTASTAFSALTGSTNTTAAMLVGTGATLGATGSGTITATAVPGGGITGSNSIPPGTLPLATTAAFGAVKCDGTTITCTAGIIASIGGSSFQGSGVLASRPATCTPGSGVYQYFATDQPALKQLFVCSSTNTWTQYVNIDNSGLQIVAGTLGIDSSVIPGLGSANSFTAVQTVVGLIDTALTASSPVCTDGSKALTTAGCTGGGSSSHNASAYFSTPGTPLTSGQTVYAIASASCTVQNWSILVDAGTATVDVWKITSTTALPTISNTITASATPAIASGTAISSTTLTGWTTSVTAGDVIGINLKTVATATLVGFNMGCQ